MTKKNKGEEKMKLETKRKRFFENRVDAEILDIYTCDSFTEFTVMRGGDVDRYRVYGNDKSNFEITMK